MTTKELETYIQAVLERLKDEDTEFLKGYVKAHEDVLNLIQDMNNFDDAMNIHNKTVIKKAV